ncbi:MAG: hypothetical protein Ct9H300mP11_18730 [Chloroflexota bacterium]|nr:MAG: hypothetical protein Ct9H300mP11_18730 [Chloroflexota bacterium]
MAFIRSMKAKYEIVDESKTFRAVIDYLIATQNVHDDVFWEKAAASGATDLNQL